MAELSLKDAIDTLENELVDFTALEIITFTGSISAMVTAAAEGKPARINWDAFLGKAKEEGSELKLVAATRILLDGDTQNFQTSEQLPRLPDLLRLHEQAVINSREARQAVINFFVGAFKNILPPRL